MKRDLASLESCLSLRVLSLSFRGVSVAACVRVPLVPFGCALLGCSPLSGAGVGRECDLGVFAVQR